jgi:ribosomal protein S18 acetylase RimI-like enzyme
VKLSLVPISKELQKAPFDCGNPDLNHYFRHYALKNDALLIGKTFVAVDQFQTVAGYMTLSNAQIEAATLPDTIQSALPRYPVPAVRIAKLAVNAAFQDRGVGSWLLRSALQRALDISASVGIFTVLVDAIDDTAKGFYLKYGFIPLQDHALTLFLPLATIRKARENATR